MLIFSARPTAKNAATWTALLMVVCGPGIVHGQEEARNGTDERLLACDGIRDPAEKMACFDAVVKSLRQTDDVPTAESLSASSPASEPYVAAVDAAAPIAATPPVAAASAEIATSDRVEPAPAAEEQKFGLEDTMAEPAREKEETIKDELESVQAIIVEVWPTIDQRFEVRLDNGQVWRETSGSRIRMPRAGSTVLIKRASLGSYRMKIDDDNRLAAVRRTK